MGAASRKGGQGAVPKPFWLGRGIPFLCPPLSFFPTCGCPSNVPHLSCAVTKPCIQIFFCTEAFPCVFSLSLSLSLSLSGPSSSYSLLFFLSALISPSPPHTLFLSHIELP